MSNPHANYFDDLERVMTEQRREGLKNDLRAEFERHLDERVDRYLSVKHQQFLANHHFAYASTECLSLYRDGYFSACIMQTQAVNEGILRLVAERNSLPQQPKESKQDLAKQLRQANIVSAEFVEAFVRIQSSFRNDFHHMNSNVRNVDLEAIAKRNIEDLAIIEREIFEHSFSDGNLVLVQPKYWDIQSDGSVPIYVRCR